MVIDETLLTKKCPYCSEEINIKAIKCKHCGEFLDSKTRKEKIKGQVKKSSGGEKVVLFGLIFGAIAFTASYFLFGNILGQQISIINIFTTPSDAITSAIIAPIRNKILISTIGGLILGGIIATILNRKE